jgi:antitoxin (DNA-binding transcriptional repressor) of toxin-antitoxin stability system
VITVTAEELGRRFYELVRLVEKGETIVVIRDGKAIADLVKHRKEPDQMNKSA